MMTTSYIPAHVQMLRYLLTYYFCFWRNEQSIDISPHRCLYQQELHDSLPLDETETGLSLADVLSAMDFNDEPEDDKGDILSSKHVVHFLP